VKPLSQGRRADVLHQTLEWLFVRSAVCRSEAQIHLAAQVEGDPGVSESPIDDRQQFAVTFNPSDRRSVEFLVDPWTVDRASGEHDNEVRALRDPLVEDPLPKRVAGAEGPLVKPNLRALGSKVSRKPSHEARLVV
jgi:hypothetical protein